MERTCKKCGETKPIEEFKKIKTCRYGRGHVCKKCVNKYKYIRERQKPGYKESRAERRRRNYNPEKAKVRRERFKSNNPESVKRSNYKRSLKNTNEINDSYIKLLLCRYEIHAELANLHPELIENLRNVIKLKRSLKSLKNESTTNS